MFDLDTQRFAEAVDADLNLFLVEYSEKPPIAFHSTALPSANRWRLTCFIDRSEPKTTQLVTIVRALVQRRLPREQEGKIPPWFVAGIYHRARQNVVTVFPENTMKASSEISRENYTISLQKLMATDIPTHLVSTYTVYADMSAVALQVFHRKSNNALSQIIILPSGVAYSKLPEVLSLNKDAVEGWFESQFKSIAKSPTMTPDEAYSRLETSIRNLLAPEQPDKAIETILYSLELESVPKKSRRELLTRCYQLRLNCPPLMVSALDKVITAVAFLHAGKERDFLKRMPVAWAGFARQRGVSNTLAGYLSKASLKAHGSLSTVQPASDTRSPDLQYQEALDRYLDLKRPTSP